jgi:hypothetical protein
MVDNCSTQKNMQSKHCKVENKYKHSESLAHANIDKKMCFMQLENMYEKDQVYQNMILVKIFTV